jgi:branched-chain amino acid aminotransferase
MQCFEGMKAYKPLLQPGASTDIRNPNEIRLFRPEKNVQRLAASMQRLGMPGHTFDGNELIQCIASLVRIDESFIPTSTIPGYALYIRPTVIAAHPFLGLCPPEQLLLFVICCPVGPYFKTTGFQPVKLVASTDQVRAWPGGTGSNKIGGNYAGTILTQQHAVRNGYEQVLWLLNDEITEVGSMNIFFLLGNPNDPASKFELVTPPLSRGDILPGVTRDSILELARSKWKDDIIVSERNITMTEVISAYHSKRICEAFGAGTAAVVVPVGSIHYKGKDYEIPVPSMEDSFTQRVWDTLTGIQYGSIEGPDGWSVSI